MSNSFISVFGSSGGGSGLPLTGGTLTGPLINSTNSAASTPVVSLTGTTFTGGTATTTKPTLIVEPASTTSTGWSTAGTLIGANAATGFTGRLIDCQLNGASRFSITSAGVLSLDNSFNIQSYGVADSLTFGLQGNATCAFYGSAASSNRQIRMTGGGYFGWATGSPDGVLDLILGRSAAATLQLGVNAASGVNQTIKACDGTAGTGGNLTLAGGTGTTTNGAVIVTTALLGTSSGATQPAFGAAINPDFGIYFESQRLMFREGNNAIAGIGDLLSGIGMIMGSTRAYGWSGSSPDGTYDLQLNRTAAANLGLGAPLASGWVNQILSAAGGRIGTDTNNSPTNTLTIAGSVSTGTGTGGNLRLGVYGTNGTSGTAIGTLNTVLTVVAARKVINLAGIPTASTGISGDVYSNAGVLMIVP